MAIAYVQTCNAVDGSTLSSYLWNTFGAAVTSGNAVVGCVSWAGAASLTSIVDNQSNVYSHTAPIASSGGFCCCFWRGNITNGPNQLTINLGATSTFVRGVASEYSGAYANVDPTDGKTGQVQATPGTGTDAITSTAITTTANGDVIWGGCLSLAFQAQAAAGTGFTSRADAGAGSAIWNEDLAQGTAGARAATFTQGAAGETACFVIALSLAGPVVPPSITRMGAISL